MTGEAFFHAFCCIVNADRLCSGIKTPEHSWAWGPISFNLALIQTIPDKEWSCFSLKTSGKKVTAPLGNLFQWPTVLTKLQLSNQLIPVLPWGVLCLLYSSILNMWKLLILFPPGLMYPVSFWSTLIFLAFKTLQHLCCSPLNPLQFVHILLKILAKGSEHNPSSVSA